MKMRKIFLTGLLTVASVLCLAACKKEEPKGRSEEEKQAITASMETGMDQKMFRMSLGHNIVVLRLNHPAVSEFMAVQKQYYKDLAAWEEEKEKNRYEEPAMPEKPDDFLRISLISDLDASEFTQFTFWINGSELDVQEKARLVYSNADNDEFSNSTEDGKSIGLEYRTSADVVRIVLRAPGYTMEQLENMQVLIETEEGIVGADADPVVDYNIPDDVMDDSWEIECEKVLSDFEYAKYLKNTTEDYQLVTKRKAVYRDQLTGFWDYCVVTKAYYYDESGALVDADCLHFYEKRPEEYTYDYAGEDRNVGGVTGLYRSQEAIEEMMKTATPKQRYFYMAEEEYPSFDPEHSYFSNPVLTTEQICNYGELGYSD